MQGYRPCTPLKPFLKEGFKNPKNFNKIIFRKFLKGVRGKLLERSFPRIKIQLFTL